MHGILITNSKKVLKMISDGDYIFREGKAGDRCAAGWADPDDIPALVLEYKGKQVVAAHGSLCYIIVIQSFDQNRKHGTKFIELWEKYAKENGCEKIEVDVVGNAKLEHILKDKRGFESTATDGYGDKTYIKKL